jgi:hypothetical protein
MWVAWTSSSGNVIEEERQVERESQEDMPSMPPAKQREAMGVAGSSEERERQRPGQADELSSMTPEDQAKAMGLGTEAPPSKADVEPEVAAYEANVRGNRGHQG